MTPEIRILQQDYIRAIQDAGRIHRELLDKDFDAFSEVREIIEEMATTEPYNWTAFEMCVGFDTLMATDKKERADKLPPLVVTGGWQ